jgi:hypothetical protein
VQRNMSAAAVFKGQRVRDPEWRSERRFEVTRDRKRGNWVLLPIVVAWLLFAQRAPAQDCTSLLGLFQGGSSTLEIAQATGLTTNEVEACRRELSQPIFIGPAGAPPRGAAGPAPVHAAGPPPRGAAGPPPVGAAGAPPVGREVKRLP